MSEQFKVAQWRTAITSRRATTTTPRRGMDERPPITERTAKKKKRKNKANETLGRQPEADRQLFRASQLINKRRYTQVTHIKIINTFDLIY
jgi:hypothetical protein